MISSKIACNCSFFTFQLSQSVDVFFACKAEAKRTPAEMNTVRDATIDVGHNTWCRRGDLNPHALTGASPLNWCVCLFRHFDLEHQVTDEPDGTQSSILKQECKSDDGKQPHSGKDRGDAVEILLGRS